MDRGAWGYSPWGHKESNVTEHAHATYIPFHYGLLQDIEQSSLYYTVGSCLSILYIVVSNSTIVVSANTSNLSFSPLLPFGNHVSFLCL